MSLSYSIIKSDKVSYKGTISLRALEINNSEVEKEEVVDFQSIQDEIVNKANLEAQDIVKRAIAEAEEKKKEILSEVEEIIQESEKKGYTEGYNQGTKNGYEDGYKEAYEEHIERAREEATIIRQQADELLFQAKENVVNYMEEQSKNIIKISLDIASSILREHFKDEDSMSNLLKQIIEEHKSSKTFIIKCNSLYKESIESQIDNWKSTIAMNSDIFIIADDSIDIGNAIVQKDNGKVTIGIDCGFDRLRDELLGE